MSVRKEMTREQVESTADFCQTQLEDYIPGAQTPGAKQMLMAIMLLVQDGFSDLAQLTELFEAVSYELECQGWVEP